MKNKANIDLSVLMLFFNRPDRLAQVFAQVRKARPARLFLYQDGARGPKDTAAVEACRAVVSDEEIDWECEVHRNYQTRNYGCDPSGFMSQQWAFSLTDKCMVLEDDVVPAVSFFRFCKEMLDRYEHDPRVWMIAGFNAEEHTDLPESYFFTRVFSIWGWASWRRAIETRDASYSWMNSSEKMRQTQEYIRKHRLRSDFMRMCANHQASGKAYFESIFWASMMQHDALAVMPTHNMVNNIGVSDDSTHFRGSLATMPRRMRSMFTMARHEIKFPLSHPTRVEEYLPFRKAVYLRYAWDNPCRKVQYSIEELFLNLRHGNFRTICQALRQRVSKWMGKEKHR